MKVLLLNSSDNQGGAAVAAVRQMEALLSVGIEVRMLVLNQKTTNPRIKAIHESKGGKLLDKWMFSTERLHIFLRNGLNRSCLFHVSTALSGYDISHHPWVKWADIIHLHWINQGFLSLKGIENLSQSKKPIIWTMHDMWPVTAICHHARECVRYQTECGFCPQISSTHKNDLSHLVWMKKSRLMSRLQPTLIGCSKWLAGLAQQSALTTGIRIESIPNPIDTDLFSPKDRYTARKEMGLPENGILVLFGAVQADDPRKGIIELSQAMKHLKRRDSSLSQDIRLVVFGALRDEVKDLFPDYKIIPMGYIKDAEKMAHLYRSANIFVTPSLEENLPNTIMESLSVGTPCVAFQVGGIPEMIIPNSTGYLAKYKDPEDLCNGIIKTIELNQNSPETVSKACRSFVLNHYSQESIAQKLIELYNDLI